MSEYLIQGETLTCIADAIRSKTGSADAIAVGEMAGAIDGLKTGGGFPNGTEWTQCTFDNNSSRITAFTQIDGIWFASSYDGVLHYSTDGKNYYRTSLTNGSYTPYTIYKFKNGYLAFNNGASFFHSNDGITWSSYTHSSTAYIYKISIERDIVVMATDVGLFTSDDGIDWTCTISGFSVYNLEYKNGIWVIGTDDNGIYYSTDGTTWLPSNIISPINTRIINGNVNGFMAVCNSESDKSTYHFYHSYDGATWNIIDTLPSFDITGTVYIRYINGRYYICGGDVINYYSNDCLTWNKPDVTTSFSHEPIYANGLYVSCSKKYATYSEDGINYTNSTSINRKFSKVYFRNGLWLACISGTGIYRSEDGKEWVSSLSNTNVTDLTYSVGVWITNTHYSLDGVEWKEIGELSSVGYSGNKGICNWINANGIIVGYNNYKTNGLYYSVSWEPSNQT